MRLSPYPFNIQNPKERIIGRFKKHHIHPFFQNIFHLVKFLFQEEIYRHIQTSKLIFQKIDRSTVDITQHENSSPAMSQESGRYGCHPATKHERFLDRKSTRLNSSHV